MLNSRVSLFPGKLKSKWSGPFVVTKVFQSGAIEIQDPGDMSRFKVNGKRLKHYYGGEFTNDIFFLNTFGTSNLAFKLMTQKERFMGGNPSFLTSFFNFAEFNLCWYLDSIRGISHSRTFLKHYLYYL